MHLIFYYNHLHFSETIPDVKKALTKSHLSSMTGLQVVMQITVCVMWQMVTTVLANTFIQYKGGGVLSLFEPFDAVSA